MKNNKLKIMSIFKRDSKGRFVCGNPSFNKGRILSKEHKEKIRHSNLEHWKNIIRIPWNKGLTKEDPRVRKYLNKLLIKNRKYWADDNKKREILLNQATIYLK